MQGVRRKKMPPESDRFAQEWMVLLAWPDPAPSALGAEVAEAGLPDVGSYHERHCHIRCRAGSCRQGQRYRPWLGLIS